MNKKYQIFISSTYVDLIEPRQAALEAILRMGHLPVGMERFDAADESQWEVIKRHIDNSDYYVLIIARRYGSEDTSSGLSYTHKEYRYALEQGVPCIAFMLDNSVKNWNNDYVDSGKTKKKLDAFKAEFNNRLVNFWEDPKDLAYKLYASLSTLINSKPRVGWVRGSEAASSVVVEEMSRLSKENNELKQLVAASSSANDPIQQAYRVLEEIHIDLSIEDKVFNETYLSIFHKMKNILIKGTHYNMLPRNIYGVMTSKEPHSINSNTQETKQYLHQISDQFLERITILRLVEQTTNNSAHNILIDLTDKGKELLLRIEHPN